jgi:hypothetical protein
LKALTSQNFQSVNFLEALTFQKAESIPFEAIKSDQRSNQLNYTQDIHPRTAYDSQDRTARAERPIHDSRDRTVRTAYMEQGRDRTDLTGWSNHNSRTG